MRLSRYCLLALGALTGGLACGDINEVPTSRTSRNGDNSSATSGGGGTKGNPASGNGGTSTTGTTTTGTTTGSGGSSATGGSGGAGAGGSGTTPGTGGAGGTTTTGGSGGTGSGGTTTTGGSGGTGSGGTTTTGGSGGTTTTGGSGGTTTTGGSGGMGTGGAKDAGAGSSGGAGGTTVVDAGVKVDAQGGGGTLDAKVSVDVAPPLTESGAPGNSGLWVAPNHPCYEWDALPASKVPWAHLTHLGLGYLQPQLSGGKYTVIEAPGWGSGFAGFHDAAQGFADAAHAASKKAFMMVGGAQSNTGTYAGVWNAATSAANVDAFADTIVATLKDMHLDGVELDWEEDINYGQLVSLAQKIRARWTDGLLFIDSMPLDSSSFAGLAPAKNDVDGFMPMTFLAISQWGGWVLPVPLSPLFGHSGNGYSIDDNLKGWTAAGVPASKVIMGVGGFGSVWGDSNGDKIAPIAPYVTVNGSGSADSETANLYGDGVVTQTWVSALVKGTQGFVEGWDDIGKSSYWHAPATNSLIATSAQSKAIQASLVFYETPRSMTEKVDYARAQGMRGMNFWTLNQTLDNGSSPILQTVMP